MSFPIYVAGISVLVRTSEYRGDHSTDVTLAHRLKAGETVEDLVKRLMPTGTASTTDWIELRICQEPKPCPKP